MKRFLLFTLKTCFFLCLGVVVLNVFIYVATKNYIYDTPEEAPLVGVVLIPGAALLASGDLSPIFIDRVSIALELYETKKVSKILVSGDNSTDSHNEVVPVQNYLIENGVPEEDIYLDYAGFDTYSSMYRAREIFEIESILIATQSFHLPRAVFIGRSLGIESYGVNADEGNILFRNYVREVFANVKAVLSIMFRIKPKYLGDKIPIEVE